MIDMQNVQSANSDVMKTADLLTAEAQVVAGVHPRQQSAFDRMLEDAKLRDVEEMDGERFDGMS